MHGWGIGVRIGQLSGEVFQVNQGSLYPALMRMLRRGWIRAEWRVSEKRRKARYYSLTASGRRQLTRETETWERVAQAMNGVLRTRSAEG